jgi:death-on-curing protein
VNIEYLTKADIIQFNYRTISVHGGNYNPPYNFLHEENLDYLIEIVKSEMFGQPLYPSIIEKASVYCFNRISNHIFSDGNKRTGLEAGLAFMYLNGFKLKEDLPKVSLTDFILNIASGNLTLEECTAWFVANITTL